LRLGWPLHFQLERPGRGPAILCPRLAQILRILADNLRPHLVALAMQNLGQPAKRLGVLGVLLADLYQNALGGAQVPLFEKRASKDELLADVGNFRRQRGPYYRNNGPN